MGGAVVLIVAVLMATAQTQVTAQVLPPPAIGGSPAAFEQVFTSGEAGVFRLNLACA